MAIELPKTTITLRGTLKKCVEELNGDSLTQHEKFSQFTFDTTSIGYFTTNPMDPAHGQAGGSTAKGCVQVFLETTGYPFKLGRRYTISIEEIVEPSSNLAPHES